MLLNHENQTMLTLSDREEYYLKYYFKLFSFVILIFTSPILEVGAISINNNSKILYCQVNNCINSNHVDIYI